MIYLIIYLVSCLIAFLVIHGLLFAFFQGDYPIIAEEMYEEHLRDSLTFAAVSCGKWPCTILIMYIMCKHFKYGWSLKKPKHRELRFPVESIKEKIIKVKDDCRYTQDSLFKLDDFLSDLRDSAIGIAIENAIKNNKELIDVGDMELAIKVALDKVSKEMPVEPGPEISCECGRYPKQCQIKVEK